MTWKPIDDHAKTIQHDIPLIVDGRVAFGMWCGKSWLSPMAYKLEPTHYFELPEVGSVIKLNP